MRLNEKPARRNFLSRFYRELKDGLVRSKEARAAEKVNKRKPNCDGIAFCLAQVSITIKNDKTRYRDRLQEGKNKK